MPATTTMDPPLTPEERLDAATSQWAANVSALGGAVVFSEVALIDGTPRSATFSARTDSEPVSVTTWRFDDAWRPEGEESMDGVGFVNVTAIVAADFTADDTAELLVQFTPNRAAGAVFGFENGAWVLYEVADGLEADTDGLFGFENTCEPSCADGNNRRYELVWDGSSFRTEYDEPVSESAPSPASPAECETYFDQQFEPYSKCSSGSGVKSLQEALSFFGYLQGSADGFFGPGTERAVRAAQRDYGVPEDGIAAGLWFRELMETYSLSR